MDRPKPPRNRGWGPNTIGVGVLIPDADQIALYGAENETEATASTSETCGVRKAQGRPATRRSVVLAVLAGLAVGEQLSNRQLAVRSGCEPVDVRRIKRKVGE